MKSRLMQLEPEVESQTEIKKKLENDLANRAKQLSQYSRKIEELEKDIDDQLSQLRKLKDSMSEIESQKADMEYRLDSTLLRMNNVAKERDDIRVFLNQIQDENNRLNSSMVIPFKNSIV